MELGGLGPPTSWVRSRRSDQLKLGDLQVIRDLFEGWHKHQIAMDYRRLRPIEPLVGREWPKSSCGWQLRSGETALGCRLPAAAASGLNSNYR